MDFKQEIEFYGDDLKNLEISPFEMIDTFHRRSMLHQHFEKLTADEKALIKEHDLYLLKIAQPVYEHLKKVDDFQSDKPVQEWWWHLDKVMNAKNEWRC